jgi:hypothetical protein
MPKEAARAPVQEGAESSDTLAYIEDALNQGVGRAVEAARRRLKGLKDWGSDLIEL